MQQEAAALSRASGYGGSTRLPSADGEHPEWQFARMGAYAFLIETHTQFQPSYTQRGERGHARLARRPLGARTADPGVGPRHRRAHRRTLTANIELLNVTFSNGEANASGGAYGAYHIFLPPGTYDIRFSAPGYAPAISRVTVTATSATVLDVQLTPIATEPDPAAKPRIVWIEYASTACLAADRSASIR